MISVTPCPNPNQVYSACGNDNCLPTCNANNQNCLRMCTTPGCICAPGFVNNGMGGCIRPTACRKHFVIIYAYKQSVWDWNRNIFSAPPMCPNGRIFSACNCQRTCARNDISACLANCTTSGCICMPGFVLDEMGANCIHPLFCSKLFNPLPPLKFDQPSSPWKHWCYFCMLVL